MDTPSNIYLGTDGAYHDDTDENREQFPAAEDAAPEDLAVGVPGETASPPGTLPTDAGQAPDSGTLTEAGESAAPDVSTDASGAAPAAADSGEAPVTPEPAPKNSTK